MPIYEPGVNGDDGFVHSGPGIDTGSAHVQVGRATSLILHAFVRFPNVDIPQGATIESAFIRITREAQATTGTASNIVTKIYFNDVDDATVPTNYPDFNAKAVTTAAVDWDDFTNLNQQGAHMDSPDISAVIQEIVDRGGWASGNAMMLLWKDDGTPAAENRVFPASLDSTTEPPIQLVVSYTIPTGGAWTGLVTAGGDDTYKQPGFFTSTEINLRMGSVSSPDTYVTTIRFQNVPIPQGATITASVLSLTAVQMPNPPATDHHMKIKGNAVDDAAAPTSEAGINGLARTTAAVDWDPSAWVVNTRYTTSDISSVIQEIVDRAGWASGNDLQIIIEDDGSVSARALYAASFDHTTRQEPWLTITYLAGGDAFMGWGPIPI